MGICISSNESPSQHVSSHKHDKAKSSRPDLDVGQLTPQVSIGFPTPGRPGEITHQLSTNSTTSNRKKFLDFHFLYRIFANKYMNKTISDLNTLLTIFRKRFVYA